MAFLLDSKFFSGPFVSVFQNDKLLQIRFWNVAQNWTVMRRNSQIEEKRVMSGMSWDFPSKSWQLLENFSADKDKWLGFFFETGWGLDLLLQCCKACPWTHLFSSYNIQRNCIELKITDCTCSWGKFWTQRYMYIYKTQLPFLKSPEQNGCQGHKTGYYAAPLHLTPQRWGQIT